MGAAAIPIAAVVVGAATYSAYSQYQAGEAANAQGKLNRALADQAAADAIARGELEAGRRRMATSATIATQRAGLAAGNIDVQSGTAAQVQTQARLFGELDAQTIRNNAAREAWGYQVQGVQAENAGKLQQYQARMSALGSILGGAGKVAAMYAPTGGANPDGLSYQPPAGYGRYGAGTPFVSQGPGDFSMGP